EPKEKMTFMEKLSLKPKVLTVKPPSTRRAKKDDDIDYVPSSSDPSEEDDPTLVPVPEPKPKGIKLWQIPFVMDYSTKPISILYIMSKLFFRKSTKASDEIWDCHN
ncbi:MAG: hypothetical protein MJE68_30610, partial [Proteobacteria bacterium]|nr:hypothetical protein [Pseudomonadota bacterium]